MSLKAGACKSVSVIERNPSSTLYIYCIYMGKSARGGHFPIQNFLKNVSKCCFVVVFISNHVIILLS